MENDLCSRNNIMEKESQNIKNNQGTKNGASACKQIQDKQGKIWCFNRGND